MLTSILFFFYFFSLVLFSLIRHPVYYCLLLIFKALVCSLINFSEYGFSWYPLLFCLVYIGGVYILFIFVSVHTPNVNAFYYWGLNTTLLLTILSSVIILSFIMYSSSLNSECRRFLKTEAEGYFYVCMCLTLLFGFFILSMIMSVKFKYYR